MRGSRDSSMRRKLATIPTTPTGTLTKKIQFQLACSVSRPPIRGPIASARAETPAQIPIAGRAGAAGTSTAMIESVAGFISAAPAPWTTRAAMSISPLVARPQASEAAVNTTIPRTKIEAPAVRVGQLPADQHQRGERERVAGDDPLELRQPDAEVALDRRQRDVHDRVVQHDHEQPERHRRERPPLLVLLGHEPCPHVPASCKLASLR